jgi:hypothetical protein
VELKCLKLKEITGRRRGAHVLGVVLTGIFFSGGLYYVVAILAIHKQTYIDIKEADGKSA